MCLTSEIPSEQLLVKNSCKLFAYYWIDFQLIIALFKCSIWLFILIDLFKLIIFNWPRNFDEFQLMSTIESTPGIKRFLINDF